MDRSRAERYVNNRNGRNETRSARSCRVLETFRKIRLYTRARFIRAPRRAIAIVAIITTRPRDLCGDKASARATIKYSGRRGRGPKRKNTMDKRQFYVKSGLTNGIVIISRWKIVKDLKAKSKEQVGSLRGKRRREEKRAPAASESIAPSR